MPVRTATAGIILVIIVAITVSMVEYFIPLSRKFDMNAECRAALLKMENQGGLSAEGEEELETSLGSKGFTNITITCTENVKQGELINLRVEADYVYSKLTGIFTRANVTQHMLYDHSSLSRVVAN